MRTLGLVVLLVIGGCSKKEKETPPAAPSDPPPAGSAAPAGSGAPAGSAAPSDPAAGSAAPSDPPAGSAAGSAAAGSSSGGSAGSVAAPGVNPRKAKNLADIKVTGEFEATLQGGGATCMFKDKTVELKANSRALGDTTDKPVNFVIKKKTDKDAPENVQFDIMVDKKLSLFQASRKGSSIAKLEVAADGTSASFDVTLANAEGKTVKVAGTFKCSHIGSF